MFKYGHKLEPNDGCTCIRCVPVQDERDEHVASPDTLVASDESIHESPECTTPPENPNEGDDKIEGYWGRSEDESDWNVLKCIQELPCRPICNMAEIIHCAVLYNQDIHSGDGREIDPEEVEAIEDTLDEISLRRDLEKMY